MKRVRILRAGMLAGASVGILAIMPGCVNNPRPDNGYVICDDTANASACPNTTAPVVIDNAN